MSNFDLNDQLLNALHEDDTGEDLNVKIASILMKSYLDEYSNDWLCSSSSVKVVDVIYTLIDSPNDALKLFEVLIDVSLDDEGVTDIVHDLIELRFIKFDVIYTLIDSIIVVVIVSPQTAEKEVRLDDIVGNSIQSIIHFGPTKRDWAT